MANQLILALFAVSFLFSSSFAQEKLHLTFSTSVSTVQIGHPFTGTCRLHNFNLQNTQFSVFLNINKEQAGYYRNTVGNTKELLKNEFIHTNWDKFNVTEASFNNLTHYHFTVFPTSEPFATYQCNLFHNSNPHIDITSNYVYVNAIKATPTVTFTTNVSQVEAKKPFTGTCSIGHFDGAEGNYSVKFFSKRDGLLATYEVKGNKVPLLTSETHDNVTINFGDRFNLPTFDLQITESSHSEQWSYWCTLEDDSQPAKLNYKSNQWPEMFVHFTSHNTGHGLIGSCSVAGFNATDTLLYNVKFFSQPRLESAILLATYTVTPSKPVKLLTGHANPYWSSIVHGNSTIFPTFEVVVDFHVFTGSWWCTVDVGVEGTVGYREYKSNAAGLA